MPGPGCRSHRAPPRRITEAGSTVDSVITRTPRDRPRGMVYRRVWVLIEGGSAENELWEMENCMCFHRVWVICGMGYYRVDCITSGMSPNEGSIRPKWTRTGGRAVGTQAPAHALARRFRKQKAVAITLGDFGSEDEQFILMMPGASRIKGDAL